eukprot:13094-Eustigmatos_ZCMA.PRE.1
MLPRRTRPYTLGAWTPVIACPMLMKTDPDQIPASPQPGDDEGVPVSVKIRERLLAARQRFHSNDNIAEFIQP